MTSRSPNSQSTMTAVSAPRRAKLMHSARRRCDSLCLENVLHSRGHILVLAFGSNAIPLLARGHLDCRKTAVHLRELEANVAAA